MTTKQNISTDGITTDEGGTSFSGREAVNAYAFVMLQNAVVFRIRHGGSMLRGKEALMARNYGWSDRKAFSPKLLDDLNAIAREFGLDEKHV
jgi:hypothetical protein